MRLEPARDKERPDCRHQYRTDDRTQQPRREIRPRYIDDRVASAKGKRRSRKCGDDDGCSYSPQARHGVRRLDFDGARSPDQLSKCATGEYLGSYKNALSLADRYDLNSL
jgi:hypothetical protein